MHVIWPTVNSSDAWNGDRFDIYFSDDNCGFCWQPTKCSCSLQTKFQVNKKISVDLVIISTSMLRIETEFGRGKMPTHLDRP